MLIKLDRLRGQDEGAFLANIFDGALEVETVAGLAQRPGTPTVLIASHRLSALRHCDTVLVLERGRLVAEGPHAELVEQDGIYRDTWRIQSQRSGRTTEAAS